MQVIKFIRARDTKNFSVYEQVDGLNRLYLPRDSRNGPVTVVVIYGDHDVGEITHALGGEGVMKISTDRLKMIDELLKDLMIQIYEGPYPVDELASADVAYGHLCQAQASVRRIIHKRESL